MSDSTKERPATDLLKPGWSTPDHSANPCHDGKPVVRMAVMDGEEVSLYMGCQYCGERVSDIDWPLTIDWITSNQLRELNFEIV